LTVQDDFNIFLASKPAEAIEFKTLEFFHSDFSGPLRFVLDFVDQTFTLESTAPRDASTAVLFTALAMEITDPAENQEAVQILQVSIGATNDELQTELNKIQPTNVFEPIECIYRKFYSSDLNEPVFVRNLSVSNVNLEGYNKNLITAEDIDLAIKPSGELYTLSRFPTLRDL